MKKISIPLALILLIHVSVSIAFNLATPIFEPSDEFTHFLFVRYLQVYHALPVQDQNPDGPRAHHPPLYHLLGALISAWISDPGPVDRKTIELNPHVEFRYGDPELDNKAMWVHYTADERWPYRGQALAVHVVRLVSVMFSALAVWFTYLAARYLRPGDESFALLASGWLAFNGMVLFMSGAVQNSTSAITSTAIVLYTLIRFTRQGFTLTRWLWVGVALAIGVLLQVSALTLVVPIGWVMLYETWRAQSLRPLLKSAVGILIPVILLNGWWFARNQILYGDWTANATIAALWAHGTVMPLDVALYLVGTGIVGRYGQGLMVDYPQPIYWLAGLAALIAVVGLYRSMRVSLRQLTSSKDSTWYDRLARWLSPNVMLWALQIITIITVSISLSLYVLNYIHGVHGRYLFTAFPAMAFLLAAGWLDWLRARRRSWVMGGILSLELALTLYGLFGLIIPTYAMPRSPSPAELAQMTPLDAHIGDAARVLGYRLSADTVKPGETLDLTIYWQPEKRTDVPYTVFIHIFESNVGSLAQRDTYPGLGNYATTVWDTGRVFADTYHLRLPLDAPAVSDAEILLGLYDEKTMRRLPVTGADAGTVEDAWAQFGHVQVQP